MIDVWGGLGHSPIQGRHQGALVPDVLLAGDVGLREQVANVRQLPLDAGRMDGGALDLRFAALEALDVRPTGHVAFRRFRPPPGSAMAKLERGGVSRHVAAPDHTGQRIRSACDERH